MCSHSILCLSLLENLLLGISVIYLLLCLLPTRLYIPNLIFLSVLLYIQFSPSVVSDSLWPPWTAALQDSLSITKSWSLPKLMSIELVMPSNHLILSHPLLLLPSIFPCIRIFSNESVKCIRWPKFWSFRGWTWLSKWITTILFNQCY